MAMAPHIRQSVVQLGTLDFTRAFNKYTIKWWGLMYCEWWRFLMITVYYVVGIMMIASVTLHYVIMAFYMLSQLPESPITIKTCKELATT